MQTTWQQKMAHYWRENRGLVLFLLLMMVFRSAFADWNTVPTGSMKPTILEGDRILVNKMAYDLRLPFTHISLIKISDPSRGDIIVFDSKAANNRLVKRVIGLPGDVISMHNNVLSINGEVLNYERVEGAVGYQDFLENLPGQNHKVRLQNTLSPLSSFAKIMVPDNSVLALGDNRDNSADSRVIGFVPRDEIIGRTEKVVLSFNYDNYYLPRSDRFLKLL